MRKQKVRGDWRLGCCVYATPEGFKGSPTVPMLRETLRGTPGVAGGGPGPGHARRG